MVLLPFLPSSRQSQVEAHLSSPLGWIWTPPQPHGQPHSNARSPKHQSLHPPLSLLLSLPLNSPHLLFLALLSPCPNQVTMFQWLPQILQDTLPPFRLSSQPLHLQAPPLDHSPPISPMPSRGKDPKCRRSHAQQNSLLLQETRWGKEPWDWCLWAGTLGVKVGGWGWICPGCGRLLPLWRRDVTIEVVVQRGGASCEGGKNQAQWMADCS